MNIRELCNEIEKELDELYLKPIFGCMTSRGNRKIHMHFLKIERLIDRIREEYKEAIE